MPNTVDLSNKLGESEFDGQYEQGINLIEELTQDIELKTQPIQEENIEKLFFQKLPLINRLAKMMDKTGLGASKAAYYFSQSAGSLKAARSLQITGAVIAGIDFFTIPLAFLAYKIAGKPFPYSFSKGVKFVYSMVILSLAITAFFVSPAVAAFLPLITVSLGLGSAIINLVKHSSSKWFLNKDEKLCLQEIQDLTNRLQQFKTEVVPKRLSELSPLKQQNAVKYNAEVSGLCLQQKLLVSQLQTKLNRLEVIKHRQHKVGTRHTVDKTTGFGLSCAALAGIICLIIAPPIGMILLAGTLATSITYVVGRGIFEVIKPLPKKKYPNRC